MSDKKEPTLEERVEALESVLSAERANIRTLIHENTKILIRLQALEQENRGLRKVGTPCR